MKIFYIIFFICFSTVLGYSQQISLVTPLQNSLNETSGLIYLNQKLITHNDSGGSPALYEIDTLTGNIDRTVIISNATNKDWEDIACDSSYIYVADFGNNNGNRTNLKIYRVSISDYFSTQNDTVSADIISYSYSDQTNFSSSQYTTNYDAEALISYNDSLYIFTKNWGNFRSNIYTLPKIPGTYQAHKIDSINSSGLITGATLNPFSNTILLSGYSLFSAFVMELSNFSTNNFSSATSNKISFPMPANYSYQTEGIATINYNQYFLSSESSSTGDCGLFIFNIDNFLYVESIIKSKGSIYPNPSSNSIHINQKNFALAEIYDINGILVKVSKINHISLLELNRGSYIILIKNDIGNLILREKLIIL